MHIAVIGGGAAGFFAAITCKQWAPDASVTVYEKSNKLLAKVKISGGRRCNVTHACYSNLELAKHYPRGGQFLKKAFSVFQTQDTVAWFENKGVKLKTESDNRMFPISDNSQTVIDCLLNEARRLGIGINKRAGVSKIESSDSGYVLQINGELHYFDRVIVATGGHPKATTYQWLEALGHQIISPMPSLFSFNMPNESIRSLMGVVANSSSVTIQGTKFKSSGPLLITHWGMSGPAILKLSAFAARELNKYNYCFNVSVNWMVDIRQDQINSLIQTLVKQRNRRKIVNKNPFQLPSRLWLYLVEKIGIPDEQTWETLSKKRINQLVNILSNDIYRVEGKTTFKEEFVTCGGVSLKDVDVKTMQSKKCQGLYFAGEVLDIDGVTGGFNFQAAWTTGYIAGKHTAQQQ